MLNRSFILPLIAAAALGGCATLDRTDRDLLLEHHVSQGLYERMIHREPLSLSNLIEASQRHLSPAFIIHYLTSTGAVYRLDVADISRLERGGVDKQVIDYLLSTPAAYAPQYEPYGYPYPYAYPFYHRCYDEPFVGPVIFIGGRGHHHWR